MYQKNAKTDMLEHSKAKVQLYSTYLSTYLNIMARVRSVSIVFLFDLFAGEGLYENDQKGSAIVACEVVKNHYYANRKSAPKVRIWFNDNGKSRIISGISKIDRLKKLIEKLHIPPNTQIKFFEEDYEIVCPRALSKVQKTENAKGLFFLDPYGYKDIDPEDIRSIIVSGDTEVILFLPISHMYRFAKAALDDEFPGSTPLRTFLKKLFGQESPNFSTVQEFIDQLIEKLRKFIGTKNVFVDSFLIERDSSNVYALFFFTGHERGYEKMLETKWRLDRQSGRGFRRTLSIPMFSDIELRSYPEKLLHYISNSEYKTNHDLYQFGLDNGFLPKHTNIGLNKLFDKKLIERFSLDGKANRGNYIAYQSNRIVGFRVVSNSVQDNQI